MPARQDPATPSGHLPRLALSAAGIGVLIAAVLFLFYELSRPVPHTAARGESSLSAAEARPEILNASTSPSWTALSVTEKAALYPLAGEWDKLGTSGQAKWLAIADRFPTMTQTERERTQERMAEWARLSPEQRRIARDSYLRAHALPPEKRAELLQKYQDLPDQEKEHLAEIAREHHSVVAIKSRPREDQPLPTKAQIREGSQQPVPGVSAAARAFPAGSGGSSGSVNSNLAGAAAGSVAPPPVSAPAATAVAPAAVTALPPATAASAASAATPAAPPAPPPAAAPSPQAPAVSSAQPASSTPSHP